MATENEKTEKGNGGAVVRATVAESPSMSVFKPAVTLAAIQEGRRELHRLIADGLKEDVDFGTIPGTKRPSLWQPGAQQVAGWFMCRPTYVILSEEHDHDRENTYIPWEWYTDDRGKNKRRRSKVASTSTGLHVFRLQADLIDRVTGEIVGSGVGACSTMEEKYISRPNDLENTVLKMAKKRAYVDAVLTTFALSDRFTQDTEDLPQETLGGKRDADLPTPDQVKRSQKRESGHVGGEDFPKGDTLTWRKKKMFATLCEYFKENPVEDDEGKPQEEAKSTGQFIYETLGVPYKDIATENEVVQVGEAFKAMQKVK